MENYQLQRNVNIGFRERRRYELLDGKVYYMARPSSNHNAVVGNIHRIFGNFLRGKKCRAFVDGIDVKLSEKDTTVPDVMIVCNPDIIKKNKIDGAPDLIVEVLSLSTAKNDIGYKKDLYEKHGVKEYWIVSPGEKSVQVYLLKDGAYVFDNIYHVYEDWEIESLEEDEKSEVIKEFKTSLEGFGDLLISVDEVFENVE
ncbi:MAG: Uma2 family endonuclease [Oscillospiraceae bacterium]|nr:Uma2 family endonuclease [Oscillospiraceae bacterium]